MASGFHLDSEIAITQVNCLENVLKYRQWRIALSQYLMIRNEATVDLLSGHAGTEEKLHTRHTQALIAVQIQTVTVNKCITLNMI